MGGGGVRRYIIDVEPTGFSTTEFCDVSKSWR
jgi:hypothetical protein